MENNLKYIVYCTTNKINNKIYIGVHQTNKPYGFDNYLGCGCELHAPSTYENPKTRFQCAVKKYGPKNFVRKTMAVFDHEDEAYALEEIIVNREFLARPDVYNMVLGGKTGVGTMNSMITYQYDMDGNYIREHASINKAALEIGRIPLNILRAIRNKRPSAGYYWTTKKFDKLDLTIYTCDQDYGEITVYQYAETGEFECAYDSMTKAAELNGLDNSNLSVAIRLGTKCGGKYFLTEYAPQFSIAKTEKIKNTIVYQYDLDGNFIQEWPSANKAAKTLGFRADIHTAIKLGRTAGGYQ